MSNSLVSRGRMDQHVEHRIPSPAYSSSKCEVDLDSDREDNPLRPNLFKHPQQSWLGWSIERWRNQTFILSRTYKTYAHTMHYKLPQCTNSERHTCQLVNTIHTVSMGRKKNNFYTCYSNRTVNINCSSFSLHHTCAIFLCITIRSK